MGRKAPPFLWRQKKTKRSDGDTWLSQAATSSTSLALGYLTHLTSRQLTEDQASERIDNYKPVCILMYPEVNGIFKMSKPVSQRAEAE